MDKCVIVCFSILCAAFVAKSQNAQVDLDMGGENVRLYGLEDIIPWEGQNLKLHKYFGVPFAQPPVDDLRFQRPQSLTYMESPFNASTLAMPCVQFNLASEDYMPQSEDCLYLNVYVPGIPADSDEGHAVAIWVHGGGFLEGAASQYDGTFVALYGNVIVVTINYRLGVYGLLSTEDENAPGNNVFWDQHMAFKWVNQNIKSFGGDPGRVTIFGESAGAMSVSIQGLITPNTGLFQRIIAQSGAPLLAPSMDAKGSAMQLGEAMKCDVSSTWSLIDCMKKMSNEEILEAAKASGLDMSTFQYVIDKELIHYDLSKIPYMLAERDLEEVEFYRSLDVMNGFNEFEGPMMVDIVFPTLKERDYMISRDEMREYIKYSFPWLVRMEIDESVAEMVLGEYTNWTNPESMENVRVQLMRLYGDLFISGPVIQTIHIHAMSTYSNNYVYYFTADPDFGPIESPYWLPGPNHADELPFMFGIEMSMPDADPNTSWEVKLSRKMVTYWTNFMKNGNPNVGVEVTPEWPLFEPEKQTYLNLEEDTTEKSVGHFLYARENNFWYKVFPHVSWVLNNQQDMPGDNMCTSSANSIVAPIMMLVFTPIVVLYHLL